MYGEFIIGVNMLFNFVILSFANKVGNVNSTRRRLILASFVGALPVTFFPSSVTAVVAAFIAMTVCAFGISFEPWKKSASVVLIGALFAGGMLTAFQYQIQVTSSTYTVLTYSVVAYVSLYVMKKKWLDVRIARRVSELKASSILHAWGAEIAINVFVDTGNTCTEPLSGTPVHFVSYEKVEDYIPAELKKPLLEWDPIGTPSLSTFPSAYQKSIRLIRLMTVQGKSWAIGFKFERWIIEGNTLLSPGYIVLTKNDRKYPDGAGAILHVSAMESINEERGTVHAA